MRRHPVRYWWAVIACCCCAPLQAAHYSITEIPQIGHAVAVNREGVVVGDNLVYVHRSGVVNQLANSSMLTGVNDLDQISGDSTVNPASQAAVWNLSGGFQLLGMNDRTLGGAISNSGFVIGGAATAHLNTTAVVWRLSDPGAYTGLPTLDQQHLAFFDPITTANAVNNQGVVVGSSDTVVLDSQGNVIAATTHAISWQNGVIADLGTLPGGGASAANGINDEDEIVGESDTAGGAMHAFLLKGKKLRDLGNLANDPALNSSADAINDGAEIVGWSQVRLADGTVAQHAFVRNAHMRDLQSLIEHRSPLSGSVTLTEATAINCKGWIVADGFDNSSPSVGHAYLLIPRRWEAHACREGRARSDEQ